MRQLGAVVQSFVWAMFDTRHDRFLGCGVALELIGDQHPRDILEALARIGSPGVFSRSMIERTGHLFVASVRSVILTPLV